MQYTGTGNCHRHCAAHIGLPIGGEVFRSRIFHFSHGSRSLFSTAVMKHIVNPGAPNENKVSNLTDERGIQMTPWIRSLILLLAGLLLFGCDKQGRPIEEFGLDKLERGVSTEGDVRSVMGQPEIVREEESGERTLEYPKGPEGVRTWFFTIGKDGKLRDYKQVLTEENFARIKPGLSKDEVRRMLGKPRSVVQFKLKNEEVWDWRYLDRQMQTPRFFNVHFDMTSGKVTGTSSSDATNY
jgi:outer membrane protein assembly factor BamE (lipoprotein component of BamABCDE complex)